MSEFNDLMRDITNVYLAGMGLPPLKASGQAIGSETTLAASLDRTDARPAGPEVGSPLYERLRKPDTHDFRDRGDALEKVHPDPRHWSRWAERTEFDWREP